MTTERKIFNGLAMIGIGVIIEGLYSAARHAVAGDAAAVLSIVRVLLAWWITSAIVAVLKEHPEK